MKPLTPNSASQVSPAATPVWFEYIDSSARKVCVAGTFNDWRPEKGDMLPWGEGRWLKKMELRPGTYEYCLVVDGKWIPDPSIKRTVSNPFGGKNSVFDLHNN